MHTPRFFKLILLILILTSSNHASANSPYQTKAPSSLASIAETLEDPSGKLTIHDVTSPEKSKAFSAWGSENNINYGFTSSAHWIRIPISNLAGEDSSKVLEIPYAQISEISFFAPNSNPIVTGNLYPVKTRPFFHRFYAFPIQTTLESRYFYIRVASSYALTVPIMLWQEDAFYAHQQKTLMVQFLYYGGLLTLLIYNIFLFISLKNRQFLYYALFAGLFGMGMLAGNGYGRLLLWPDLAKFDDISQTFLLSLTSAMGATFTSAFLDTRNQLPRIHRLLKISALLFIVVAAFLVVSISIELPTKIAFEIFALNAVLTFFLIVLAGIKSIKLGYKPARFFSLAWGMLFIGAVVATLRAFGIITSNTITEYVLQISSSIEMLIFSLALAAMIAEEKIQREAAQQRALIAENKLVKTLQSTEKDLKKLIAERTKELEISLAHEKALRNQYVRFSALIAHEFRNPLSIIQSQLSLIRKEDQKGTNQIEKRSNIILDTTNRLAAMFDGWLDQGRVQNALSNLNITNIKLMPWLEGLIKKYSVASNQLDFEIKLNSEIKSIEADTELLQSALNNLIDNAVKYSPAGSTITIETLQKPGYVGIAVIDHGIGIAPKHQEKVFDEYFRVSPEGTTTGIGLGLALVKEIAKAHKGYIDLKSKINQGSTFTIWIPST